MSLRAYSPEKIALLLTELQKQPDNCSAHLTDFEAYTDGPRIKFTTTHGSAPALGPPGSPWMRLGLHDGAFNEVVGFFDAQSAKMSLKSTYAPDSKDGKALLKAFGPGSPYAKGLVEMAGQITSGKKKKITQTMVDTALRLTSGKPDVPQPLKPRIKTNGDSSVDVFEFNWTIYLAEPKSAKRDRSKDIDGLPPSVAEANFPSDHPIVLAFMDNDRVPKEPRFVTADNTRPSAWEIIKAASFPSPSVGHMFRAYATQTIGGFGVHYNEDNKLYMLSMYANGPGVKVFALPEPRGGADVVTSEADMDAYAMVLGPEAQTKRAYDQVDDGAEPPAKRAAAESE